MGLIGAGLGALAGGIASIFAGPAPTYKSANFNDDLDLTTSNQRAGRSASELAGISTEGAAASGQALMGSPEQRAREETALGGASGPELSDAIARRAQKSYGRDITQMNRQAQVYGTNQKYKDEAANFQLNQAKQKMDMYQKQIQQQVDREQQAAMFSVLSNLTQGVGAMAGASVAKIMQTNPNAYDRAVANGSVAGPPKPGMMAYGFATDREVMNGR